MNYRILDRSKDGKKVCVGSLENSKAAPLWLDANDQGNPVTEPTWVLPSPATRARMNGHEQMLAQRWANDGRNSANRGGR